MFDEDIDKFLEPLKTFVCRCIPHPGWIVENNYFLRKQPQPLAYAKLFTPVRTYRFYLNNKILTIECRLRKAYTSVLKQPFHMHNWGVFIKEVGSTFTGFIQGGERISIVI